MTTILERFNTLVPYFITFSFQVLRIISEQNEPGRTSFVSLHQCSSSALSTTQNPKY